MARPRKAPKPNPANVACIWMVTGVKDAERKVELERRIEQLLNLLESEPDVRVSYASRNPNGSLAVGLLIGEEHVHFDGAQTALLLPGVKRKEEV